MHQYQHGKDIIQIAYADDNQLMQDLIPVLIDGFENCKVTIQAYNGAELIDKLSVKPDTSLVLMDLKMPVLDGVDTARIIRQKAAQIKILFFSMYTNELVYKRILSSSADGFISKNCTADDLRGAIYSVMKSGYYLNFGAFQLLRSGVQLTRQLSNGFLIKEEEVEFLRLVGTEMTYENIAQRLNITMRHLDYIRERLFIKFNLKSRVELAILASNAGLGID